MRLFRLISVALFFVILSCVALAAAETKLTVQVNSADTGKPVDAASVVIKFRHGPGINTKKLLTTNWETKTNQEGNITLPAIPQGEITVQIIAQHYQTYGTVYQLTDAAQTLTVKLNRPQPQYSEDAQQQLKKKP